MILHNTLAVFRFELQRSLTVSRIGVWLLLVSFPIFIVSVMKQYEDAFDQDLFGPRKRVRQITIATREVGNVQLILEERGPSRKNTARLVIGEHTHELHDLPLPENLEIATLQKTLGPLIQQHLRGEFKPPPAAEDKPGIPVTVWGAVLFGLIPEVIVLFGLLLWVTPIVQAELEGRTWIYLAVRPRGRISLLLGKYLTGTVWTFAAGLVSASASVYLTGTDQAWRLWASLTTIVLLACLGYGALYSLIGVLLHRRAMVIAVAYTLILEFLVSFIPAVINQFTVQYRLRNLFVQFMGWTEKLVDQGGGLLVGDEPLWQHILLLSIYTIALLTLAAIFIQRKEYATAEEA